MVVADGQGIPFGSRLFSASPAAGIELICPHRRGRRVRLQDDRPLCRYRKRWKIQRTFAHLGNFRRLLIRHDRLLSLYQGFFHLAYLILTLRHF